MADSSRVVNGMMVQYQTQDRAEAAKFQGVRG